MSGEVNWVVVALATFGGTLGARLIQEERGEAPIALLPHAQNATHWIRVRVLWCYLWTRYLLLGVLGK